MTNAEALTRLADEAGLSVDELLEASVFDGECWGICKACGYTTEPCDPDAPNWCENCDAATVIPAPMLAGII